LEISELITYCDPVEVSGPKPEILGDLVLNSSEVTLGGGDVFIALKGHSTDGHKYIGQALASGASTIICEYIPEDINTESACFIEVQNTRKLAGPLAQKFAGNPAKELIITGITGTNGKTTVATLVHQVLRELGIASSLSGTVHTAIGDSIHKSRLTTADPVSLAHTMKEMVESGSTHLAMEVSSHALNQLRVKGVEFDYAAFTNLSHDHLDYHGTLEEYARAKKRLFDGLNDEAIAIVNFDDHYGPFMVEDSAAKIISFGFENQDVNVPCYIISENTHGSIVKIGDTVIETPLIGRFNAYNAAQTYLICKAMGFEIDQIKQVLANLPGAEGRMEQVKKPESDEPLVLVDYAHTPDALLNVLSTLKKLAAKNQIVHVLFGAGGDRDKTKRPEMARTAEKYADQITVTSDNPRTESPEEIIKDISRGFTNRASYNTITDRSEAIKLAIKQASSHEIILIAGKGHETYQEINGERIDFDDRKIARKALATRKNNKTHTREVG